MDPDLRRIETFLRDRKMPVTLFGRLAAKDPRLVLDLRNGRRMGEPLRLRVRAFIESRVAEQA